MSAPKQSRSSQPSRRRQSARMSGEQRELEIISALQRLLADRPLHEISVDDLAQGAGISRPTFYFYFASKEAVLVTLLERLVSYARAAQGDAPQLLAHDPARAWRQALGGSYATWVANRDVIRAAAEARATSTEIRRLWERLLESFVEQTAEAIIAERRRGAAPAGIPADQLALCLNRMNERIFETTLSGDELTLADDHVLDALVDVWLRAIYGQPPTP